MTVHPESSEIKVNIAGLPAGLYFVRIHAPEKDFLAKIQVVE
jgi:hypothetical protein